MLRVLVLASLPLIACVKQVEPDGGTPSPLDAGFDAGEFLAGNCNVAFAASDLNGVAAIAIQEFMTSDQHLPCPGVGCDSTVAIPWCGPFRRVDGGTDWVGGLLAAEDLSVVQLSAFRGQLLFAAAHVSDPRSVPLRRIVSHVFIPDRVGPFQTRPQGFGMLSDAGVAEPPTRCFAEFADATMQVTIPRDWRYYWRPVTYNGWAYCGPVGSERDGG